ncbi:MAG: hypothetical protein JW869_04885 [Candidatus Omnitrophica bacterium]|nr:hypothetical protein [Candidatus Omnitrophota bacterium]
MDNKYKFIFGGIIIVASIIIASFMTIRVITDTITRIVAIGLLSILLSLFIYFLCRFIKELFLVLFGWLFIKEKHAKTKAKSMFWRCPKCGAKISKGYRAGPFAAHARIVGTTDCEICGAQVNIQDIYSGKYDVDLKMFDGTKKALEPCQFLNSKGQCVPPGHPEQSVSCSFTGNSYEFCSVYPELLRQKAEIRAKDAE